MNYSLIIVLLVIGSCIFTSCSPSKEKGVQWSADKTEALIFLFDDIAVTRSYIKDGALSLLGSTNRICYQLVSARWLNEPTLVNVTGYKTMHVNVAEVKSIYYDKENKTVYGKCVNLSYDNNGLKKDEREEYFIFQKRQIIFFELQQDFDNYTRKLNLVIKTPCPTESLFK